MITELAEFYTKGCGRCDRFATPDCSVQHWATGLNTLREICLAAGLEPALKWGHPCFAHAGRNIAILGAFRGDFRISFFNAALMKDPEGVLEKQGANARNPDMIRFTSPTQPAEMAPTIAAYLQEAMTYAEAGIKPAPVVHDLILPDELVEALDANPELAEAFHALTPGRQRSYVIALASAKTSATRQARVVKLEPKIMAGKGANEY